MDAGGPRHDDRHGTGTEAGDGSHDEIWQRLSALEHHVAAIEIALLGLGWRSTGPVARPAAAPPPTVTSQPIASPAEEAKPWSAGPVQPLSPGPVLPPRPWPAEEATAANGPAFDLGKTLADIGPGRLLALAGGGALLLGMAYFLSLAFANNWIGPELRVALGLVAGFGLLPVGGLLFDRERPTLAHVVVAVGLGTIELALFASRLYELVPAEVALVGALLAALVAGYIAVRWDSELVALMGIAAVLAAPPIVGAPASLVTVGFLGAVLVGVAYVSYRRNWPLMPWVAFALTGPQLYFWATGAEVAELVLIVLAAYWALFAGSALVPALADAKRDPVPAIALLGAIAGFTALTAYGAFGGTEQWLAGALLGALAGANLATGIGLVRERSLADNLTQAVLALAGALALGSVALLLDGPGIVVGWTLVMLAAAFIWVRFALLRAAVAAALIGSGATCLIVGLYLDNLFDDLYPGTYQVIPYADADGVALAALLLAIAAIGWFTRHELLRQYLLAGGVLLVALTVPFEALTLAPEYRPSFVVVVWTGLTVVALALDRAWHPVWRGASRTHPLPWAGAILGALTLIYLVAEARLATLVEVAPVTGTPFTNEQSLLTMIVVVAIWALALTRQDRGEQTAVSCASLLLIAALLRQQLPLEWAVVGLCALAVGTALLAPSPERAADHAPGSSDTVIRYPPGAYAAATTVTLLMVFAALGTLVLAPLARLTVVGFRGDSATYAAQIGNGPPNAATIALLAVTVGLALLAWHYQRVLGIRWLWAGVLVAGVYLVSIGLVDLFAAQVPSRAAVVEIAKQAQVALTILWAVLGLALLALGLIRDWFEGRAAGLALLGLATAKAFVFDLASLDVAYRVLSLIGLGILLLVGAFGYQRVRSESSSRTPHGPHTPH